MPTSKITNWYRLFLTHQMILDTKNTSSPIAVAHDASCVFQCVVKSPLSFDINNMV